MNYRQSPLGNPRSRNIIVVLCVILVSLFVGCPFADIPAPIMDNLISLVKVEISNSVGIGLVSDTIQVMEIDPQEAEVIYQWQRGAGEESDFVAIDGASDDSYELQIDDVGCYVRVAVTGFGAYKGTVYSTIVEVLSEPRTINIPDITGVEVPAAGKNPVKNFNGEQYFAQVAWDPSDTPFRAGTMYTATISIIPNYGYTCEGVAEDFFTVEGAASTSNEADSNKVHATYSKTANAALVSISGITGTMEIRKTITAGSLSPGGATATYQWLISDTLNGTYVPIDGETGASYIIKDLDLDKYLKVKATGTGAYTGTVTSAARGPINPIPLTHLGNITGTAQVGNILTLGTVWPTGATVVHFWLSSPSIDGVYSEIDLAPDSREFKLTVEELGLYIKGQVEGVGLFDGIKETAPVGPVAAGELEAIGNITGKRLVNEQLTAGNLTPIDATASYQWQFSDTRNGTYEDIPGDLAKLSTYVVAEEYWEKYIRVLATGTDGYEGTVASSPVEITYSIGDQTDNGGYIFFNKGVRDNAVGSLNNGVWDPQEGETASTPWRYLEAAPAGWSGSDDPSYEWDSSDIDYWTEQYIDVEDLNQYLGGGLGNTTKILSAIGGNAEAATACANYSSGDWYLGNTTELSYMMNHLADNDDLNLTGNKYWSSNQKVTENGFPNAAYSVDLFGSFFHNDYPKSTNFYVRPIRMF